MTVPYYAEPGFSPPPFLETLGVIEDLTDTRSWRCDIVRGTSAVGLCDPCYEYLRDTDAPSS